MAEDPKPGANLTVQPAEDTTELLRLANLSSYDMQKLGKDGPSEEEVQLVFAHLKRAYERDLDSVIAEHEPALVAHRAAVYAKATADGVTAQSDMALRQRVVGDVVTWMYTNVEPPDAYTKATDPHHFKEVAALAVQIAKKAGRAPAITLVIAAWLHDVERFLPCTKCQYLPERSDKYRKRIIHAVTSARVAMWLLEGAPVTDDEKHRIYELIKHHETPPDSDMVLGGKVLLDKATDDVAPELQVLMDADSLAFFESTIQPFVHAKAKKYSKEWIWQRVSQNIRRLNESLRADAGRRIMKLPEEVRAKMGLVPDALALLCNVQDISELRPDEDAAGRGPPPVEQPKAADTAAPEKEMAAASAPVAAAQAAAAGSP